MGIREKFFRQKLIDQLDRLLAKSQRVATGEKLSREWIEDMLTETQELTKKLTIYQFLHELPENVDLQIEFLELAEKENQPEPEPVVPGLGEEILKEIDEFEVEVAEEVEEVQEQEFEQEQQREQEDAREEVSNKGEEGPKEVNDIVAPNDTTLADKLSKKTISKLADSISLNERFLFSGELFNGNMTAFKQALTELDHIATFDDAMRYIERQLKTKNSWNMEAGIVQDFIALVKRRFD